MFTEANPWTPKLHRPPRDYPAPVPREPMRIAAPPVEPTPASSSLIQTLSPVIGGVGIFGFALVYGNKSLLYIGAAMMVLLVGFSALTRWSQRCRQSAAMSRQHPQGLALPADAAAA